MSSALQATDFLHFLPVIFFAAWACFVLLVNALGDKNSLRLGAISLLGIVLTTALSIWSWQQHGGEGVTLFGGMVIVDRLAIFLDVIILVAVAVTVLISEPYLEEHQCAGPEFFPLVLLTSAGMMLLVHANDFIALLIGLETMSLGIYALVACWWGNRKSSEGGIKYFIMGAVASAFLLYGIALLYGATGTTNFSRLAEQAPYAGRNPLYLVGMVFIVGASAFKVALAPFHMWAPDAYEGAPTPITGLMATAVKTAGFGILLRVVSTAFDADQLAFGPSGWLNILWTLSVITMTVGNLAALKQTQIKRMLAYSSISHAGYLTIGVITIGLGSADLGPFLYYLLSYAVTTGGAFAIVSYLGRRDHERLTLGDWDGLATHHPVLALMMTFLLASLGGIPPTAGFFAKFYLFKAALAESPQLLVIVIIAALNSVLSIFYYLRPVVAMYFREPRVSSDVHAIAPEMVASGKPQFAIFLTVLLVLTLGILPSFILQIVTAAR